MHRSKMIFYECMVNASIPSSQSLNCWQYANISNIDTLLVYHKKKVTKGYISILLCHYYY